MTCSLMNATEHIHAPKGRPRRPSGLQTEQRPRSAVSGTASDTWRRTESDGHLARQLLELVMLIHQPLQKKLPSYRNVNRQARQFRAKAPFERTGDFSSGY